MTSGEIISELLKFLLTTEFRCGILKEVDKGIRVVYTMRDVLIINKCNRCGQYYKEETMSIDINGKPVCINCLNKLTIVYK